MPAVDVVIPALDPGPYLAHALESLKAQSFEDWRAVVVDDGSVEDLSWVRSLDARIELVRQTGGGAGAARNRGIAEGSAPLVAFLDADDIWLPSKLERQLAELRDDILLMSTAFEIIDGAGVRRGDGFEGFAGSHRDLLQGNGICTSTVILRRAILARSGGFDPALSHGEDWDLWIRIAALGRVVKLEEPLVCYRVHATNLSRDYLAYYRQSCELLERYRSGVDGECVPSGRRRVRRNAGAQAFDRFRSTRAPRHLAWALRLNPGHVARSFASLISRRRLSR